MITNKRLDEIEARADETKTGIWADRTLALADDVCALLADLREAREALAEHTPCPTSACLTQSIQSPLTRGQTMHVCWTHRRLYNEPALEESRSRGEEDHGAVY